MTVRQDVVRRSALAGVVMVCLGAHPGLVQSDQRVPWTHLSSTQGQIPAPDVGRQVATLILDIDKDGVNDFVVASYEKMAWFRRSGEGWTRYVVENGTQSVRMEAGGDFLDLDGDGDLDILMAAQSKVGEIWWWENPHPDFAPGKPWKRYQVIAVGGTHHDQIFGDFDGDGKTELAFWYNAGEQLFLAEIPADPTKPWPVTLIAQLSAGKQHPEGFARIDLNGDGKLDIVGGGYWFEHVAGTTFKAHPVDEEYRFSRSATGDLIEGGWPEIVICSGDSVGPLALYHHNGGKWTKGVLIERVDHGHTLRVGDINGDGHSDIYTGEMYNPGAGANCRQWVLYGDGKGNFLTELISTGIGCHESRIGDLDGDGDTDILQKDFQQERRVDVWLNHIKDLKRGVATGKLTGSEDVNNDGTLGTGQIELPRILRTARELGVRHYFIEDESPIATTQIPQSLRFLESLSW